MFNPAIRAGTAPPYKSLTPFLLASSIKHHGWSFLGNHIVPPFLANMMIGVALYSTYMAALPYCSGGHESENLYPPLPFPGVFVAGAIAGVYLSRTYSDKRGCADPRFHAFVNSPDAIYVSVLPISVVMVLCLH